MTEIEVKIADLSKTIDSHHIEFMVKRINEYNGACYAQVLAYKNARVDMEILDDIVGPLNWQNKYERDSKGVLQCGIGIYDGSKWIWKWSNGVPSQFESVKGEYSDALKRAGYLWGIGRSLYHFPSVRVQLNEKEYRTNDKGKLETTGWLKLSEWDSKLWIDDNGEYEQVVLFDNNGNERFNLKPHHKKYKQ